LLVSTSLSTSDYSEPLYQDRPQVFTKYVMPMLSKILEDTKPDIKAASIRLAKTLNEVCPDELRSNVPVAKL
jgi:hypothetical protein